MRPPCRDKEFRRNLQLAVVCWTFGRSDVRTFGRSDIRKFRHWTFERWNVRTLDVGRWRWTLTLDVSRWKLDVERWMVAVLLDVVGRCWPLLAVVGRCWPLGRSNVQTLDVRRLDVVVCWTLGRRNASCLALNIGRCTDVRRFTLDVGTLDVGPGTLHVGPWTSRWELCVRLFACSDVGRSDV